MTQAERILEYLRAGNQITPAEAYEKFGCLALHSRIAQLRGEGHNIACRMVTRGPKRWGSYYLVRQVEFAA